MATRYPSQQNRLTNPGWGAAATLAKRRKPPRAPRPLLGRAGGFGGRAMLREDAVTEYAPRPAARESVRFDDTPQLSGGMGSYSLGSDPAVARMAALSGRMRAEAQASAAAKRKQAVLEYGDPTGVEGIDEATAKAARENPFSILKSMERAYGTGVQDLEEQLNKSNLFYSGYRGQQLGEAATAYQQQRYDAGNRFRGVLTDIADALANALMNADMMDADASMGSDGGYYDPGFYDDGYYEEEPAAAAASGGKPKAKPKPKARTVRVAGKAVPIAAARRQLNRAISEAKVRASAPRPKAKPKKPAPRRPAPRRSGR